MQIDAFSSNNTVEEDHVGKQFLPSDVYEATVKLAYLEPIGQEKSKKMCVILDVNGQTVQADEIVLNKTGTNKTNKDPNKLLPGFLKINSLCVCALGKELKDISFEEKDIKIKVKGVEEVAKRLVPVELVGKLVGVGIQKAICSRQQKQGGQYVATDRTYETNLADKYFNKEGKTHSEIREGKEAGYMATWLEKNKGKTFNKVPSNAVPWIEQTGVQASTGQPAKSLFD